MPNDKSEGNEISIDLGELFRKWRQEQSFNINELAERATVDMGTISRIENGITQATLPTAFRLCTNLGITSKELCSIFFNIVPVQAQNNTDNYSELTSEDVEKFLRFNIKAPNQAHDFFIELLNHIFDTDAVEIPGNVTKFTEQDLEKILSPTNLYSFVLHYPSDLTSLDVVDIYKSNGVLIQADLNVYLDYLQKSQLSKSNVRLISLAERLSQGAFERFKFIDLIELDSKFTAKGMLFDIWWQMFEFESEYQQWVSLSKKVESTFNNVPEFTGLAQAVKLSYLFIIACRWHRLTSLRQAKINSQTMDKSFWILELRQKLSRWVRQLNIETDENLFQVLQTTPSS